MKYTEYVIMAADGTFLKFMEPYSAGVPLSRGVFTDRPAGAATFRSMGTAKRYADGLNRSGKPVWCEDLAVWGAKTPLAAVKLEMEVVGRG